MYPTLITHLSSVKWITSTSFHLIVEPEHVDEHWESKNVNVLTYPKGDWVL